MLLTYLWFEKDEYIILYNSRYLFGNNIKNVRNKCDKKT